MRKRLGYTYCIRVLLIMIMNIVDEPAGASLAASKTVPARPSRRQKIKARAIRD